MLVNLPLNGGVDLLRQIAVRVHLGGGNIVMDAVLRIIKLHKGQHPEQPSQHGHIGGSAGQSGREVQPRQHQAEAGGGGCPAADHPAAAAPVAGLSQLNPRLDPIRQLGGNGDAVIIFLGVCELLHHISAPSIATRSFFRPAYRRLFTVLRFCPVIWLISFRLSSS